MVCRRKMKFKGRPVESKIDAVRTNTKVVIPMCRNMVVLRLLEVGSMCSAQIMNMDNDIEVILVIVMLLYLSLSICEVMFVAK